MRRFIGKRAASCLILISCLALLTACEAVNDSSTSSNVYSQNADAWSNSASSNNYQNDSQQRTGVAAVPVKYQTQTRGCRSQTPGHYPG
jgi:hypothetical protein